jgi:hypothetical protein
VDQGQPQPERPHAALPDRGGQGVAGGGPLAAGAECKAPSLPSSSPPAGLAGNGRSSSDSSPIHRPAVYRKPDARSHRQEDRLEIPRKLLSRNERRNDRETGRPQNGAAMSSGRAPPGITWLM